MKIFTWNILCGVNDIHNHLDKFSHISNLLKQFLTFKPMERALSVKTNEFLVFILDTVSFI